MTCIPLFCHLVPY
uniref:Uncharacterized protein n=1 Tax=Amphimedon queenslandica TaxID=400682 RepID=A0A1X7TRG3_AMPQE